MRASNRKTVLYLLRNDYDDIWLKAHTPHKDLVYAKSGWYRALDLWNLFDGICFDAKGKLWFIQVKTNRWAQEDPIREFLKDKLMLGALIVNVRHIKGRWVVNMRIVE